jgi:hypothetical protein
MVDEYHHKGQWQGSQLACKQLLTQSDKSKALFKRLWGNSNYVVFRVLNGTKSTK